MENKNKKIISILGDSISTFAGYTPAGAVFYDDWRQRETGVADPGATWWMQVIEGLGGVLGVNNSYSGSTVSCGLLTSGTSLRRLETLGAEGDPDIILVSMGANDWGFGIHPQEFEREYRRMLQRLRRLYPNSTIYCGTILRGQPVPEDEMFFNVDSVISPNIYSDIIRRTAVDAGCLVADLAAHHMEYETIDGVHPNKEGMKLIACLWLKELKED